MDLSKHWKSSEVDPQGSPPAYWMDHLRRKVEEKEEEKEELKKGVLLCRAPLNLHFLETFLAYEYNSFDPKNLVSFGQTLL